LPPIARRSVLAAVPALAAARALAAPSKDIAVRGSKAYSESAMVMSVAPDGASAMTLRFCRFPVEGYTWLWCHVLVGGELHAFTSHDLPATAERLAGAPRADYRAAPMDARLARDGRGADLKAVRVAAALPFHRGVKAPHGPGDTPGRFEGLFHPTRALAAQVLEGRDEVYGTFRAHGVIGGRPFVHEGPAKFHEQRQEAARFEAPFDYAWLAGEGMAATTLLGARGASGGWQIGDGEEALADLALDPPGDHRSVRYRFRSGRVMPGRLDALVRYEIPIYDRVWNGSFVKGEVDGRPVAGVANDWVTAPDIYAAAAARAEKW
jgi:hypothetical protein